VSLVKEKESWRITEKQGDKGLINSGRSYRTSKIPETKIVLPC
jgi:hypothetical protein